MHDLTDHRPNRQPGISFQYSIACCHCGERKIEVIKLLLAHHARTDIFDSNGHTCLHTAAFHDDNVEMIRLLIEHGADVNARVEGGETALSLAIKQGNHHVAELLREYGARL